MDTIPDPVGEAMLHWRTEDEGGRRVGPPVGLVYRPTTVFVLGVEEESQSDWPWSADLMLSVLVERVAEFEDGSWLCKIGFLFPDLAVPYLIRGQEFLILEGRRIVATAKFTQIYDKYAGSGCGTESV